MLRTFYSVHPGIPRRRRLTQVGVCLGLGFLTAVQPTSPVQAAAPDLLNRGRVRPTTVSRDEVIQRILQANPQARRHADGSVYLGRRLPPQPWSVRVLNRDAADTTNADQLWSGGGLGLSLTGAGVTAGIWDGGLIRTTHQELTGRVTLVDGGNVIDHATHVAGTLGAVGVVAQARGMASQVVFRSRDYLDDAAELAADAGLIDLSNHSYANTRGWEILNVGGVGWADVWAADRAFFTTDPFFGKYEQAPNAVDLALYGSDQLTTARQLDQTLHEHPHLLAFWAAGNDRGEAYTNRLGSNQYVAYRSSGPSGPGLYLLNANTVPPPGADGGTTGYDCLPQSQVAKNSLVVGAVHDITADPYTPAQVSIASFSSLGPTDDGRVKPDCVANGTQVYSSINISDSSYRFYDGTSSASPGVAGTAALLLEHYRNLTGGSSPRSATLKGLILHTAFDAGNAGPDYTYGWGVADGAAAAVFLSDALASSPAGHFLAQSTYGGATQDFPLTCTGSGPLKATIVWTDPPPTALPGGGLNDRTRVLVNDLDLVIIGPPGATTYHPWTLDPDNPSAPAVQTVRNNVDNVEQVRIDSPAAGIYTVRVNHTGGSFSQPYTLLATGGSFVRPTLVGAVSRKTHGAGVGIRDINVLAGHTECRSGELSSATGNLLIVATFDRNIARRNLEAGDVTTNAGSVGTISVTGVTVSISITGVSHIQKLQLAFPGIADANAPGPATSTAATLCLRIAAGDFSDSGRTDFIDFFGIQQGGLIGQSANINPRADFNLDGTINYLDHYAVKSAGLLDSPQLTCP